MELTYVELMWSSVELHMELRANLHHDALTQSSVAVNLFDLGVHLTQVQGLDLVIDALQTE